MVLSLPISSVYCGGGGGDMDTEDECDVENECDVEDDGMGWGCCLKVENGIGASLSAHLLQPYGGGSGKTNGNGLKCAVGLTSEYGGRRSIMTALKLVTFDFFLKRQNLVAQKIAPIPTATVTTTPTTIAKIITLNVLKPYKLMWCPELRFRVFLQ